MHLGNVAISLLWNSNPQILQGKAETYLEILYGSIHHLENTAHVAKILFCLLDKDFPKFNRLRIAFNKNNFQMSYSYIGNVSQIIKETQ